MAFTKAERKAVPLIMSVSGVSGSGKTYTALLLAGGIAGKSGLIGFIDTENGRGSMYADSPGIVKALPNGYVIERLDAPFSPQAYINKIDEAERSGIDVLVIDSGSHEWDGIGGCTDIAETKKLKGMPNWALAKKENKKYVNRLLYTNMHIIVCLRAQEKTKIIKDEKGKEQFVSFGIQPIAEKNFVFEMTLSLLLDEATKHARPIKVPEPLKHLFPGERLITRENGEQIREWNQTGIALDPFDRLKQRARAVAEDGTAAYKAFFVALSKPEQKALSDSTHAENKAAAEAADRAAVEQYDDFQSAPDPMDAAPGSIIIVGGKRYKPNTEQSAWTSAD